MAINFPTNPVTGQSIYLNGSRFVYDGVAWSRAITSAQVGSRRPRSYSATAGQTVFVTDLELANFEVFLNGIKLDTSDYTGVNGTLTLSEGVELNDNVEVIEYGSYDVMKDIYKSSTTTPTDVNPGYIWYDENTNEVKVYTPSGWQILSNNTTYHSETYTATDGQAVFNIEHTPGFVSVHLNGFKLSDDEYTADGTSITLNLAAEAGDIIDLVGFTNFTLTNAYSRQQLDAIFQSGSITTEDTSEHVVDSFDTTEAKSAEYLLHFEDATNNGSGKVIVHYDGTTVNHIEYGFIGDEFCTFGTTLDGTTIELNATTNTSTTISFTKIYS